MGSVVSISDPRTAEVIEEADVPLAAGEVRLRTIFSGSSAGTELADYRGTNPYLDKTWDPARRLFQPGTPTIEYPLVGLGYEEVGEVVECAPDVDEVGPGGTHRDTVGHRRRDVDVAAAVAERIRGHVEHADDRNPTPLLARDQRIS